MSITVVVDSLFRSVISSLCNLCDVACLRWSVVQFTCGCFWKADLTAAAAAASISVILLCTQSIIVSTCPSYVLLSADTDIVVQIWNGCVDILNVTVFFSRVVVGLMKKFIFCI
jgi:hypothetical protein